MKKNTNLIQRHFISWPHFWSDSLNHHNKPQHRCKVIKVEQEGGKKIKETAMHSAVDFSVPSVKCLN